MTGNGLGNTLGAITACAVLVLAPFVSALEDTAAPEIAELMPLAARSLLLDVAKTGDGTLVAVGERGHIVTSSDGLSWTQAQAVPTRSTLTSLANHGQQLWAAGHDSVILHSNDSGVNWSRQYFDPARQQAIMDIHFFDADYGLAIGAYGLMLVTHNGGTTWEDHFVSDEEWHLNALLDLGDGRLLIAGEAGFSYRSADRGETWEVLEMPYPGSMFGLTAEGECVLQVGLRGNAQQSCDGGDSWKELETGTDASLSGAVHGDGRSLIAGNSGVILQRQGQGPFYVEFHSSGVDFAAVIDLGEGRYLMVGEEGLHHWPENGEAGS